MASADFWRFIPAPLSAGSPRANRRTSPGIAHSPSRLCLSDLRHGAPCKYWALRLCARSPRRAASIRFLFVRPALCLRLPPDSASRRTPLAGQLTLTLAACAEDLPLQVGAPGRAHARKEAAKLAAFVIANGNLAQLLVRPDVGHLATGLQLEHIVA